MRSQMAASLRATGFDVFGTVRSPVIKSQSTDGESNIARHEREQDSEQCVQAIGAAIFNDSPSGFSGIAFNTRKEPFSDIRVRKGLTLLQNRDELIKKLFFNEYVPLNSYYAGGIYENKNNPKNLYEQQAALQLLAEAGWKDRDAQGRLVKNGQPLKIGRAHV